MWKFFATFMYETARQYIFSVIFIISGLQIIHCLVPPLHERLRLPKNLANIFCCILSKLCATFTKRPLQITTLMAVFKLISLVLK